MRKLTLVLCCSGVVLVIAGVLQVSRLALDRSFKGIEADTARQSIERVRRALESELRQLELAAGDYANWDDTWTYASGLSPDYVSAELGPDVLSGLNMDLAWIDGAGELDVVSLAATDTARRLDRASPAATLGELRKYAARLAAREVSDATPADASSVLVRTPAGILALATAPIRHTDRSGPVLGKFSFARHLGRDMVARLEQTSQQAVSLLPIDDRGSASRPLPEDVRAWLANGTWRLQPFIELDDPQTLGGYSLLDDLDGRPLALLVTSVPRDVLQLGKRTITGVVIALVTGFTAVVLILLSVLNRTWRAREATEQRYRTVVQHLDEGIILADQSSGAIVEVNPALLRILGYPSERIGTLRLQDLLPVLAGESARRSFVRGAGVARELTMRAADGEAIPAEVTASLVEIGSRTLVCVVARDITARRQAERQQRVHRRRLAHLARHDSLTGLPNRLQLRARLPRLIGRAREDGTLLALLYIDLDHFKNVNDSLGHGSGDRLLIATAQRLRTCAADHDLVARMGGDEFVVIATGLTDRSQVDGLARRIQEALGARIEVEGAELSVALSIGVAIFPDDGEDLEHLLKAADIALYQAKEHGRGHHRLFTASMNARLAERLQLEQALREAIEKRQLYVEYQPSFDMKTGRAVSFEALLRWVHPQHGQVPPGRFIAVAEQSGLIHDIGKYVLRAACAQLAAWQRLGVSLLPVSINVSPRQFGETRRLAEQVAECVREFGIDASLLHFEITESAVMQHLEQHLGTLQALRNLGCRILIDDFGTGYSSLSYLKHLPIDALKIDRAFVRDMATDPNDAAIVRAIVGIAQSLSLHLVAEGVETHAQLECLRDLGCQTAQGFYFARPMAAEDCRALLENLAGRRLSDTAKLRLVASGEPPG